MLIISALFIALIIQFNTNFSDTTFESIIYNIDGVVTDFEATFKTLFKPALEVIISFVIIFWIIFLPVNTSITNKKERYLKFFNKKILIFPISTKKWSKSRWNCRNTNIKCYGDNAKLKFWKFNK